MVENSLQWKFPSTPVRFLRIEKLTVGLIALLIFILTYLQFTDFVFAIVFTLIFGGIYVILSYVTQLVRLVEEHYQLTPTHFDVTRRTRFRTKNEKVLLKDIHRHKLDRLFLGGYLLSKKGKHLLYFNTKQELAQFERFLKKHWKK